MTKFTGPVRTVAGANSSPSNAFISQSGTREAGTNKDALAIQGTANTGTALMTITNATISANRTVIIPDAGVTTSYVPVSTSSTGYTAAGAFAFSPTANTGSAVMTLTNATISTSRTVTIPDAGAASYVSVAPSAAAATANKVYYKTVTATAAALASSGHVVVQTKSSATAQYAVIGMRVISSTGLSGGGGDRLLSLTDGTKVYNDTGVTAALLGTPITTRPGGTGNPDCGDAVDPTASTANSDIYLVYTGGTADFASGSVKIEVQLAQVTA